jgi:hypothetical protein
MKHQHLNIWVSIAIAAAVALIGCNSSPNVAPTPIVPTRAAAPVSVLPTEAPSATVTPVPSITATAQPSETPAPTIEPTGAPLTFTGKGNSQVALKGYTWYGTYIHATHDGISMFRVAACDAQGKPGTIVVDSAGKYDGIKSMDVIINVKKTENLCVTADGNWTLTLFPLKNYSMLKPLKVPGVAQSKYSQIFYLDGNATMAYLSYQVLSNQPGYVEVNFFTDSGGGVLATYGAANLTEQGTFTNQPMIISPGTKAIEVDADYGAWTLTVK